MEIVKDLSRTTKRRRIQKVILRMETSLRKTAIALIPTVLLAWILVPMVNQNRTKFGFGGEWVVIIAVFAITRAVVGDIAGKSKIQ